MTKTKTALISVALVGAAGAVLWLLLQQRVTRQEDARLLQRQSELIASNALLGEEVSRLASQAKALEQTNQVLREQVAILERQNLALHAQARSSPPSVSTAAQHGSEPGAIRLRKENLPRLQFDAVNENFELTETSKDLLQLTPEESARITAALQELKQRIQAHDLAEVRQVPVEELKDEDIVRFLKSTPGQPTTYLIPPFSPQEQQSIKEWFGQHLGEILGPGRSFLLVKNARFMLDFWLGGTEAKILAFVDQRDSGNAPVNAWMVKFNTPSSHGTYSGGSRAEPVPPQLRHLFEIHQPPSQ